MSAPAGGRSLGGDTGTGPGGWSGIPWTPAGFPADLRVLSESVIRSGPRNTSALVEAMEAAVAAGEEPDDAMARVFGRFPVGGLAHYGHDWLYPRFGPGWRLHQGTDVFASYGTPVRAPADGVVTTGEGGLGGLWARVTEPDGTYWYLAHLSALADGLDPGGRVAAGEVVGFVGDSGNAEGTSPHLHLEVHPHGGPAVDSKPFLDRLLDDALAALDGPTVTGVDAGADGTAPPLDRGPTSPERDAAPTGAGRPGDGPPARPDRRPGPLDRWALTGADPWTTAGVRPPWVTGPDPASADDPVVVAAGLAALGMVIGVRHPRLRPAGAVEPVSEPSTSP